MLTLTFRNNTVILWSHKGTIVRRGLMNRVNVGAVGANDRYLAAITARQIKKPTLFTKGFMRVTLRGGDRRRRVYRAARDVNRVLFSGCGNGQ